MQQESQKKYKEILEHYNFSINDEDFFDLVKNIESLADLMKKFKKNHETESKHKR